MTEQVEKGRRLNCAGGDPPYSARCEKDGRWIYQGLPLCRGCYRKMAGKNP